MDFTRQPIIETIITPKEGCKLAVKNSKNVGQEEYFVDAVEIVTFGHASFFRSLERPKPFLVPVTDYELVEVREARMVLKNVGIDRSIKIGGGREAGASRPSKNIEKESSLETNITVKNEPVVANEVPVGEIKVDEKASPIEKKRDRRRQYRKRRGGQSTDKTESTESTSEDIEQEENIISAVEGEKEDSQVNPPSSFSALLQPPPNLISETIGRYRENALFKNAFFLDEEDQYKPHEKVQELLEDDENEEYAPIHLQSVSESIDEQEENRDEIEDAHVTDQNNFEQDEHFQVPPEEIDHSFVVNDVIEMPFTPISEQVEQVELNYESVQISEPQEVHEEVVSCFVPEFADQLADDEICEECEKHAEDSQNESAQQEVEVSESVVIEVSEPVNEVFIEKSEEEEKKH